MRTITMRGSVGMLVLVAAQLLALPVGAQSFRVQCPSSTITHPTAAKNNSEPVYSGSDLYGRKRLSGSACPRQRRHQMPTDIRR